MDAIRTRDGLQVVLKRILPEEGPHELRINQLFSSSALARMPHNHCAPLLDVFELQCPDPQKFMVFPFLRPFNQFKIRTFDEFVAFFSQICEVLQTIYLSHVIPVFSIPICTVPSIYA
jgi:hypothetical protein